MAAGQDDVWTLDLFSVLKRRISCRVLARINTWEINWNNQFSAGIKAWLHKGKIYNPQVGQDSEKIKMWSDENCFSVCFTNTSLLPGSQGCLRHLLSCRCGLRPLASFLLVVCAAGDREAETHSAAVSHWLYVTCFLSKCLIASSSSWWGSRLTFHSRNQNFISRRQLFICGNSLIWNISSTVG